MASGTSDDLIESHRAQRFGRTPRFSRFVVLGLAAGDEGCGTEGEGQGEEADLEDYPAGAVIGGGHCLG
jgi:hypothetical protein